MAAQVGICASSALPAAIGRDALLAAEAAGLEEVWLGEDVGRGGAFALASTVLARTSRLRVGIGITSLAVRHPVLLAQEAATLSALYPGRFRLGIGIGSPSELKPLGLWPSRQLSAAEDYLGSVRQLLAGEPAEGEAAGYLLGGTRLESPPPEPCPLYLGGLGPKMLELGGRIGDGVIGSVASSPSYIRWARSMIDAGAGRDERRPFVVLTLFAMDADGEEARRSMRAMLAGALGRGLAGGLREFVERSCGEDLGPIADAVRRDGPDALRKPLEAGIFDDLAVMGDPEQCARQVQERLDAGADSVVLAPLPPARAADLVGEAQKTLIPLLTTAKET